MFLIYSYMRVVYICGYQAVQSLMLILFPVLLHLAGSEFLKYWLHWSVTVHDKFWQNSKTVVVAKTLRINILVIFLSIITVAMVIFATYLVGEKALKYTILKNTPRVIIILRSALRDKAVLRFYTKLIGV